MMQTPFNNGPMPNTVDEAIAAIRRGEIIIVTDDEQRENEGDLIAAAEAITPAHINFMARYGRGLICVALAKKRLEELNIQRMPRRGKRDCYNTAFMESIDASHGITTGISAADRAYTIRLLVDDQSGPQDFVAPGHTFPLEAAEGGVLERDGHTEAAVDLARLAGFQPAGVICEVMRDDGEMARRPDLEHLAKEHGLVMTSVADLMKWIKNHAPTAVQS